MQQASAGFGLSKPDNGHSRGRGGRAAHLLHNSARHGVICQGVSGRSGVCICGGGVGCFAAPSAACGQHDGQQSHQEKLFHGLPLLELANTHTPAHVVSNDELQQDGFSVVHGDGVDFVAIAQGHDMHARNRRTGHIGKGQRVALLGVGVGAASDGGDAVVCGRCGGLHLIFDRVDADAFRSKVDDAHVVHILGGVQIAKKRTSEREVRANGETTGASARQVSGKSRRANTQSGDSKKARQFFHVSSFGDRAHRAARALDHRLKIHIVRELLSGELLERGMFAMKSADFGHAQD